MQLYCVYLFASSCRIQILRSMLPDLTTLYFQVHCLLSDESVRSTTRDAPFQQECAQFQDQYPGWHQSQQKFYYYSRFKLFILFICHGINSMVTIWSVSTALYSTY